MDPQVLAGIAPDTLKGLLPAYLSGYVAGAEVSERNRQRVARMVSDWSEPVLVAVRDHMAQLGADTLVYTAQPYCRALSREWCRDLVPGAELDGAHHLRAAIASGPTVVLSNHLSYFDTTAADYVLFAHGYADVADRLFTAAGPKVYVDPLRRLAAAGLNTLPVPQSTSLAGTENLSGRELARRALASLNAVKAALGDGLALQLYPEGTRTRTGRMGPFLRGVHRYLSAVPGVLVVPGAIVGTEAIFPIGATKLIPGPARVTYGAPFAVADHPDPRSALRYAHAAVAAMLPEPLRPDPSEPAIR